MARTEESAAVELSWLEAEEGGVLFDALARAMLNMSGAEFVRRWDAGEFKARADDPEHPEIRRLAALLPLAR